MLDRHAMHAIIQREGTNMLKATKRYGEQSGLVCEFVRDRYLRPAARARKKSFRVIVGDVHRQLGLSNRVPLVCNALTSKKFLENNGLRIVERTGPPSGLSTTVSLTYEFVTTPETGGTSWLHDLRG